MTFPRVVLIAALLMFGVFGLWLLIAPDKLHGWVGIAATSPTGRTELRAIYGGLELGLAGFMAAGLMRSELTGAACLCLGWAMAGIAVARVVGVGLDGSGSTQVYAFLGTEVVMAAAGFLAWARCRSEERS